MRPEELESANAERQRRALARRARMTIEIQALDAPSKDLEAEPSMLPLEQVFELTAAAWAMTGQPWPRVARFAWPVRIRRLGEEA